MRQVLAAGWALCVAGGFAVLAVAWHWNDERYRQGPVELRLWGTHGLHRMDVRLLAAAIALWVTGVLLWSLGRKSRVER